MKNIGPGLGNVGGVNGGMPSAPASRPQARIDRNEFQNQLRALQETATQSAGAKAPQALKFSNHAVDRMQARGIRFTPEQLGRIESAVGKAQAKGAKDTLLLTDDAALIVSVKDKTVVTVMDKAALKENVFTNIDSTVMI